LLRVLNNLVKNAQQAIPDDKHGQITIHIELREKMILTRVTDNGMGIPPDQQEKIFQPNFTTKSTGSGLGLAMVKNIIEQHKGTIFFETRSGLGTSFVFELHKVE
jgi:two-component system nitrogen regulation sensor histidine kinase NtrY